MTERLSRIRTRYALTFIAFIALTGAQAFSHWRHWIAPLAAPLDPAAPAATSDVQISNFLHIASLPGWFFVRGMQGPSALVSLPSTIVASAISSACWIIGAHALLRLRARLMPRRLTGRSQTPAVDHSRRRLLLDGGIALAALGASGSTAKATLIDPWRLKLARYAVPIRDLPTSLDGLRICQISDTHLGPRVSSKFIRHAIRQGVELDPDIFVLTGDYLHRDERRMQEAAALFEPLVQSGAPVFGVLGNHDWYANGEGMSRALQRVGVHMIDNDRRFYARDKVVTESPMMNAICIAGVGDLTTHVADFDTALSDVEPSTPRLVLCHNPDASELDHQSRIATGDRSDPRYDLVLSGHTHGGQVRVPLLGTPIVPSVFGQKYAGGLIEGPVAPVLVSRGVGMSILPVRFGVPPEIVEITLRRA